MHRVDGHDCRRGLPLTMDIRLAADLGRGNKKCHCQEDRRLCDPREVSGTKETPTATMVLLRDFP